MQLSYELNTQVLPKGDVKFSRLQKILFEDLDFHSDSSNLLTHGIHSFPAKFPSQLPGLFIDELSCQGDVVFDPMMGSGTTILEAFHRGRIALGSDIDPLALLLTRVKTTPLNTLKIEAMGVDILKTAINEFYNHYDLLKQTFKLAYDDSVRSFIDYWFFKTTKYELFALLRAIEKIGEIDYRNFFLLAFSNIIIRKAGGVSLALDLAHTRPHRVKAAWNEKGEFLFGEDEYSSCPEQKRPYMSKIIRSGFEEFRKSYQTIVKSFDSISPSLVKPLLCLSDTRNTPFKDETVNLIVTSPPYASNAIDYMRAHKFSLVWMGHLLDSLTNKRKTYIGSETLKNVTNPQLPKSVESIVEIIKRKDSKRGTIVSQYFQEMRLTIAEFYRLLKPKGIAIIVVASSIIKGVDTKTDEGLAKIASEEGFEVAGVGVRNLDRNRRMLPTSFAVDEDSQIQMRMHQEFVIGLYKRG